MADIASDPPPSKTLYVKNLNESVKLPILKQDLQTTFSQFGTVINVVAHKNLRMRGQAFVIFEDQTSAQKAQEAVQGFQLHEKPMKIQFAKTPSDDTVKRDLGDEQYEAHKRQRLEIKGNHLQNILTRVRVEESQRSNGQGKEGTTGSCTGQESTTCTSTYCSSTFTAKQGSVSTEFTRLCYERRTCTDLWTFRWV
jgi:RNA recognition motif-containing protein